MTVTLTISLSEDEHAKLSAYADQRGCGLVDAVHRMIAGSIDRSAADGLTPGLFDSGDPTLADRVDEELANGFGQPADAYPDTPSGRLKARAAALGVLVTRRPEGTEQPSQPVDMDEIHRMTKGWGPLLDEIFAEDRDRL